MVIEESEDLETHLNLITDFTGSLPKMLSTTSSGMIHWRIGGFIVWDTNKRSITWGTWVQTPKQCRSFKDQNLDQTKTVTVCLDTAEN